MTSRPPRSPGDAEPGFPVPQRVVADLPPMPAICGTARLTIERIGRLRATLERATLEAVDRGDGLELSLCPVAHADALALPAHVGVSLTADGGFAGTAQEAWVELHEGETQSFRFPSQPVGSVVVVQLRFADALGERRLVVR